MASLARCCSRSGQCTPGAGPALAGHRQRRSRDEPERRLLTEGHRYAQLFVVQNPLDDMLTSRDPLWEAAYIPHWVQPGLLPRDETRGAKFENVVYFGQPENLAAQLQESRWTARLAELGLRWRMVPREQWHD